MSCFKIFPIVIFIAGQSALAQTEPNMNGAVIVGAPTEASFVLPSNTEVTVTPNSDVSSKKMKEGNRFSISTVYDVMLDGFIVIPRGTRGEGEVTWRTGKGAFGKSAKMDIELRWLDIGGRRLNIEGKHRQEGEGNTAATLGTIAAVGPFAAFVTGKSALIPRGAQLIAHTIEPLPLIRAAAMPAPVRAAIAPPQGGASQGTTPTIAPATSQSQ